MLRYLYKIVVIYLKEQFQALVLCAKQQVIQFRIVSSIYLQNIKVGQHPKKELFGNFNDYSKWQTAFLYSLFVTLVKLIYKTMRLLRTSSLGYFCTLLIITVRRTFVQAGLVQQPSFRYRFQAICCEFSEFSKCLCFFFLMHNSLYKHIIYLK